jgi:hypothetical protein
VVVRQCRCSSQRSAAIFSAHHAFFDGIGLMNLIRDTLSFLVDNDPPVAQPPSPSVDVLAGLPVLPGYVPRKPNDLPTSSGNSTPVITAAPPKVSKIQLSQELTKAIVECARQQGTTANGIMMAAILATGRALNEQWRKKDFTCVVPVNVRSLFHQEQAEGIIFGQKRFVFDLVQTIDFWEIARACSEGVKEVRTVKGLVANLRPLHDFLAVKRSVAEAVALASASPHDLMVSNFGSFDGPTQFDSLSLKSIAPIVDSGDTQTQTVMIATTGGAMTIVLVSPNPLPGLLTSLEEQLAKKCMPTREFAHLSP